MSDTVRDRCTIFPDGNHVMTYDSTNSGRDVFCCICGEQIVEFLDSQP